MLTIISVSYKSKEFLKTNYELVKALNPDTPFKWIVIQNTPESDLNEDLSLDDPRFTMIKGPALTQQESESSYYRSIHHSKALNLALNSTDADLILTLDPDCFILKPNWIQLCTKHIQKKKLCFFGVPYHPQYYTHYRGFPNAICMFINRSQVKAKNCTFLDFTPIFEERNLWKSPVSDTIQGEGQKEGELNFALSQKRKFYVLLKRFRYLVNNPINCLLRILFSSVALQLIDENSIRHKVGTCYDTGYKIYYSYHSVLKYQTFKIFAVDKRSSLVKIAESVLPDRFRFFPANNSYIRGKPATSFMEFGENGEQFFWKNQLFAFHQKGVMDNLSQDAKDQFKVQVQNKIDEYIQAIRKKRNASYPGTTIR